VNRCIRRLQDVLEHPAAAKLIADAEKKDSERDSSLSPEPEGSKVDARVSSGKVEVVGLDLSPGGDGKAGAGVPPGRELSKPPQVAGGAKQEPTATRTDAENVSPTKWKGDFDMGGATSPENGASKGAVARQKGAQPKKA